MHSYISYQILININTFLITRTAIVIESYIMTELVSNLEYLTLSQQLLGIFSNVGKSVVMFELIVIHQFIIRFVEFLDEVCQMCIFLIFTLVIRFDILDLIVLLIFGMKFLLSFPLVVGLIAADIFMLSHSRLAEHEICRQ